MFYKLSNIASKAIMEEELKATFKFPHLYRSKFIINGMQESIIPVITWEDSKRIDFAIWGMLPEYFKGEWKPFQQKQSTLNVKAEDVGRLITGSKMIKRCLIPVTGYFGFYNVNGEVKSYYNVNKDDAPFCVAGIYSQLEDGFYSCSLIVNTKPSKFVSSGTENTMQPAILHPDSCKLWLDQSANLKTALAGLQRPHGYTINRFATANRLSVNNNIDEFQQLLGLDDAV
ncbi:SOS response-associated peptidase family protein [Formosa sp. S-31]|uniref:SOS response-associated peptidase family protein n=1 Tax=Formosa sp. S-31 TaxID=2790949 RepID=UPI003EB7A698